MKYIKLFSLLCALVMLFATPTSVFAAEAETLPDPGITPNSPFYFADKWGKQISMLFTFKAEDKVPKALRYAEERLAELEAMAEQNQVQAMERAEKEYQYCLALAKRNMEKAMVKGVDTSEQVTAMMSRHIAFMYQQQYAYQKQNDAYEDCQQIRQQIREGAAVCQRAAVEALSSHDPEKALRLNLSLMEQECGRIQNRIGQEDNDQIGEALQQYERLRVKNQEMLANAEQLGLGPEAQQMAQEAIANQNGVLTQVRNQLQTRNEGAADVPLQNRVEEQTRLKLESGKGEQPLNNPTTEQFSNSIGSGQTNGSDISSGGDSGNSYGTTGGTGNHQGEAGGQGRK